MNCPRCGKICNKNLRNLCPACIKLSDEECTLCNKYLRENKLVNVEELSRATNVDVAQIQRFIREGRISIEKNPNMSLRCEVCGKPIRDNHMCAECRSRLTRDLSKIQTSPGAQEKKEDTRSNTYQIRQNRDKPS
jgi:NMD protein affecting ribosome stability and mRNA decay